MVYRKKSYIQPAGGWSGKESRSSLIPIQRGPQFPPSLIFPNRTMAPPLFRPHPFPFSTITATSSLEASSHLGEVDLHLIFLHYMSI